MCVCLCALYLVGGIYTVLRSKAGVTTAELGDQYCMLGKYNESTVKLEVEVLEPDHPVLRESIEALRGKGINVSSASRPLCVTNPFSPSL